MVIKITKYNAEILAQYILEYTDEFGKTPTLNELNQTDGYPSKRIYYKYFTTFSEALLYAGLPDYRYTDEALLIMLKEFKTEYGNYPRKIDLINSSFPSYKVYERHFGSISEAIKLLEFCNNQ